VGFGQVVTFGRTTFSTLQGDRRRHEFGIRKSYQSQSAVGSPR